MKKLIAALMVMAIVLSMAACGAKNSGVSLEGTMEENVNKVLEIAPVEFMGGLVALDLTDTTEEGLWALKNYTGLDSAGSITDVAIYEPMTGSQAFSLAMVRVAEGTKAQDIAQQMVDNINPRKWICVEANQVKAVAYGDTVMFVMLNTDLELDAADFVEAFKSVCGGEPDLIIG